MMATPEQSIPELALPALELRVLARRAAPLALLAAAAITVLLLAGQHVRAFTDALAHLLDLDPAWAALAVALESISVAGYVVLLSLVAGRTAPRIGMRESAQITLAGTAATRLLPTAGAGGAALTLWTLRRAGLETRAATRTLLSFLVVLYAVFLAAIAVSGGALALGLAAGRGPAALSAVAALAALGAIATALALSRRKRAQSRTRVGRGAQQLGAAVRDAIAVVRSGDPRLAGAPAYWLLDAAVVWAMLRAFGAPTSIAVVLLAYFVGQVANTIPIPGSVTGGIAGVLIAFGASAEVALPAVLAYRSVSIWLPAPVGLAAIARLRATVSHWAREDGTADVAKLSRLGLMDVAAEHHDRCRRPSSSPGSRPRRSDPSAA